MNANPVASAHSMLAASSIQRPPCSGSKETPGRLSSIPNAQHVRSTSWYSHGRSQPPIFVLALVLVAFPTSVSAAPPPLTPDVYAVFNGVYQRRQNLGPPDNTTSNSQSGGGNSSSGSISMNIWVRRTVVSSLMYIVNLPIVIVTVVFMLFLIITCVRRCSANSAPATTTASRSAPNAMRIRRRPRRTPSQISTKSLPPYMKEAGDHELVLFRGPSETEDDPAPSRTMPTLGEEGNEHPEMRTATFDIALDRVESVDTADSSTTNLIGRASASVPRPPELHHAAMPRDHRRSGDVHSLDSVGSEIGLLPGHQRVMSVDDRPDPRGEAPPYTEAVSMEGGMTTISLNDPQPNNVSSNTAVVPTTLEAGRARSRFGFLVHNPFSSHNNTNGTPSNVSLPTSSIQSESPALHMRSGSALSRFSTRDSHQSHPSRPSSRHNQLSRSMSGSNPNLLRALRSSSPGLHAGSSTISLDSISAPLTHTLTRAEFHAPKGGLLTPEQIKLITSREALEKFGVPYGPDAVAAFSLSREKLADTRPPPDFESVAGERQEQTDASGSGGSATEVIAPRSDTLDADGAPSQSVSPSQSSLSHRADERAGSEHASTVMSYETAAELDWAQIVQRYAAEDGIEMDGVDEPRTARAMTPRTARP
ncbi:hypothetical protein HD554DRAFT_2177315 [Boletus coccyginus]|nr:hypothetical protein HD554DRAFT_2177315 [Boletus coccyginus]